MNTDSVPTGTVALLQQMCTDSTDGRKKRAAMQGTPLMNFLVMGPNGEIIYVRALDTSGESKFATFLKKKIVEEAMRDQSKDKNCP